MSYRDQACGQGSQETGRHAASTWHSASLSIVLHREHKIAAAVVEQETFGIFDQSTRTTNTRHERTNKSGQSRRTCCATCSSTQSTQSTASPGSTGQRITADASKSKTYNTQTDIPCMGGESTKRDRHGRLQLHVVSRRITSYRRQRPEQRRSEFSLVLYGARPSAGAMLHVLLQRLSRAMECRRASRLFCIAAEKSPFVSRSDDLQTCINVDGSKTLETAFRVHIHRQPCSVQGA
ncbi:uncharacterized protein SPSK_01913 [Sporothrix schenckii 1099-18]|uniref:Uncharacterized protein n=1 Tax=Sporothrix schenckii 1099-18 TaxID=1397361 RepID=A0A0F2MCZ1_SPOSC|nr:uncharacterized protein SPSK_01913 [Sporothrix schenckii 1099-18]KJR87512.1 hypothetical protein SPSK_01913 [Sporothrix schenckii 1099-18]